MQKARDLDILKTKKINLDFALQKHNKKAIVVYPNKILENYKREVEEYRNKRRLKIVSNNKITIIYDPKQIRAIKEGDPDKIAKSLLDIEVMKRNGKLLGFPCSMPQGDKYLLTFITDIGHFSFAIPNYYIAIEKEIANKYFIRIMKVLEAEQQKLKILYELRESTKDGIVRIVNRIQL